MVDAVLLEWEDVLVDTRGARRDALRAALAAEGIAHTVSDDDEQLRGLGVGATIRTVLRHMGCSDAVLADLLTVRATRAFAEALSGGLVLAPGSADFVQRIRSRARIAVVTRAARAETELVLRLSGLEDAITTIVSADDVAEESPCAAGYHAACARLSRVKAVAPAQAVAVVGGGPAIRAARAAGMRVLAVGVPAHVAMEADAAVDTLDGVLLDDWTALVGGASGGRTA